MSLESTEKKFGRWELKTLKKCKQNLRFLILLSNETLYYFLKNCNLSKDKKIGNYKLSTKILNKLGFLDRKFKILLTTKKLDSDKLYETESIVVINVKPKKGLEKYHFLLLRNGIKNGYVKTVQFHKGVLEASGKMKPYLEKLYSLARFNGIVIKD